MDNNDSIKQGLISRLFKMGLRFLFSMVIPVVIILLALVFFKHQMDTKPKAQRTSPPKQARLVMTEPAEVCDAVAVVSAMGTVVPSRQIMVTPEVTGIITYVDPAVVPGSCVKKGQLLYELDVRDYETIVSQRQGELALAELNLKLEQANQTVAQQEYSLLDEVVQEADKEIILRQPHLAQMQAALKAAQSALEKARLDVKRCRITAPFNAIINEKNQDIGSRVSPSNTLVSLTAIDEYWIEVAVPVDQLQWIKIPSVGNEDGSTVKVYDSSAWGPDRYKEGQVIRLLSSLEQQGRMAQLLVSIKDPLCRDNAESKVPLLIDSYVRVEIQGRTLEHVFAIDEEYLHDGDNIWLMQDEALKIQPVEIVFRGQDRVYVTQGLEQGQSIILTNISAPVDGMPVRLKGQSVAKPHGDAHSKSSQKTVPTQPKGDR